ncbi:hypothetical protein LWI28_016640 [Acer negundo]|uniref:Uncharacterized protein n=1 Tax=Acer negundo TaxID=4023 RepID=A0AAD5NGW2_ACENE|nr:hypothetical protein LWI28_016640 [Acer negundo]
MPCPRCKGKMTVEMFFTVPAAAENGATVEGGFVKGVVTYMVTDNLEVKPMSTISSISMLSKFNVKDVSTPEERIVDIGISEGLKLLKASLECRTVFTSVFMAKE